MKTFKQFLTESFPGNINITKTEIVIKLNDKGIMVRSIYFYKKDGQSSDIIKIVWYDRSEKLFCVSEGNMSWAKKPKESGSNLRIVLDNMPEAEFKSQKEADDYCKKEGYKPFK